MKKHARSIFGAIVALMIVLIPWQYAEYREDQRRNFRVVEPGKLYRSGQLSRDELEKAIREYGIRTVITLRYARDSEEVPPDIAEEEYCRERGIAYHRIRPLRWFAKIGPPPADDSVAEFLDVVSDPESWPVLVHCYAGVHRTGAYCAIYRIDQNRWENEEALREMRDCGYTNLDAEWDVHSYIRDYQPDSVE